ncbi:MAG: SlyX family protein [Candidatus Omnitrophica bacterium]|nr:SlyX family protein [Candidatus Omnitrophota bacterium]
MEERIIELEKRVAFQDHMLEEMNEILVAQQKEVEILKRQLKLFEEKITSVDLVKRQEDEEPPPHY